MHVHWWSVCHVEDFVMWYSTFSNYDLCDSFKALYLDFSHCKLMGFTWYKALYVWRNVTTWSDSIAFLQHSGAWSREGRMPYCCFITSLLLRLLHTMHYLFPSTDNILALVFQTRLLWQLLIPHRPAFNLMVQRANTVGDFRFSQ